MFAPIEIQEALRTGGTAEPRIQELLEMFSLPSDHSQQQLQLLGQMVFSFHQAGTEANDPAVIALAQEALRRSPHPAGLLEQTLLAANVHGVRIEAGNTLPLIESYVSGLLADAVQPGPIGQSGQTVLLSISGVSPLPLESVQRRLAAAPANGEGVSNRQFLRGLARQMEESYHQGVMDRVHRSMENFRNLHRDITEESEFFPPE